MREPPFFTQHARNRAEDVLDALSVTGGSLLISPDGDIGMMSVG